MKTLILAIFFLNRRGIAYAVIRLCTLYTLIFDLVTLALQADLLLEKIFFLDYDFWIRGVTYCCYLHMVATGELVVWLCCLSDNSG